MVSLKAELLKKQDEFRLKKIGQTSRSVKELNEYETIKTTTTWGKKKPDQKEDKNEDILVEKIDESPNDQVLFLKSKYENGTIIFLNF